MRKIVIGLVAFVIIATAAISITWYNRSTEIKKNIASYFSSFTTADSKMTYEDIEISGFPFAMNVTIVKPHFTGRINKIAARLGLDDTLKTTPLPEWQEDYALDGDIKLSVNMFSNKFRMEMHGNIAGNGKLLGKTMVLNIIPAGDSACELEMAGGGWALGNLWNFYSLANRGVESLKDFRSVDCVHPGGNITVNASNDQALSFGNYRILISRTPENSLSDIRFYIKFKDVQATKAYDEFYYTYQQAISPNSKSILPSLYGTQNVEVDISYKGTENWNNPDAKNLPLDLKVNKFSLSNAAYQSESSLSLTNSVKDNVRDVALSYKSETTAVELLRTLIRTEINNTISMLLSNQSIQNNETREARDRLGSLSPEKIDQLIATIIPDFVSLGKITTAAEANYSGDDNLTNYQGNLSSFQISASPYGITGNAAVKKDNGSQASGNISIVCNNCLHMLDDGAAYLRRLSDALVVLSPKTLHGWNISPETIEGIKQFMLALNPGATSDSAGTLKFDFVNSSKAPPTVNGRNMIDVLNMYNQFVTPTLVNSATVPIVPQGAAQQSSRSILQKR